MWCRRSWSSQSVPASGQSSRGFTRRETKAPCGSCLAPPGLQTRLQVKTKREQIRCLCRSHISLSSSTRVLKRIYHFKNKGREQAHSMARSRLAFLITGLLFWCAPRWQSRHPPPQPHPPTHPEKKEKNLEGTWKWGSCKTWAWM